MALLKLSDVGKIYVSEGSVAVGIRGVNLEFDIGEFVAITGKSGSGKTTLLNVISGMDTYEEGELYIGGAPTSHYSQSDWERYRSEYISFIFQEYNILESFTVLENVELALGTIADRAERRRRALELIDRVGLTKFKNHKGSKLSGGQKQRTVIARALAKDSPIILADEPTGNLDSKSSAEIVELLAEIAREKLVIVVTHSFSQLEAYATREIRIYDGAVEKDEVLRPAEKKAYSPAAEKAMAHPRRVALARGIELGAHRFAAMPKLSIFMSIIMIIAMLGTFFTTALTVSDLAIYDKNYIFSPMPGRTVVIRKDGLAIGSEELAELAELTGAQSTVWHDEILDTTVRYSYHAADEDKYYWSDMRFVRDETAEPDVGVKPQSDGEALLVLPIEWRNVFGDKELLINEIDLYGNGAFMLKISGVKYYLDNSVTTGKIVVTAEGLEKMYYVNKLFADKVMKQSIMTCNMKGEDGKPYKLYETFYGFAVDSSLSGKEFYYTYRTNTILDALKADTVVGSELNVSFKSFTGSGQRTVKLYGDIVLDKCARAVRGTGSLYISIELAEQIIRAGTSPYCQSSLFFASNSEAHAKCAALAEAGYVPVVADSTYSDQEQLLTAAAEALVAFVIWILVLRFIAFFLSICSQRSILAKQGDIAILRSMGINVGVIKISMYVQMALSTIPSLLLLLVSCLVIYRSPNLNPSLPYLHALQYLLICVGVIFLNVMLTRKYNKRMFNESVRKTLKGGAK